MNSNLKSMSLSKFESMLKTNSVYFFDATEFEEIIQHYLDTGKHALAHKAVKLGLEQHPTSVQLKLMFIELLVFENELKEAITLLKEIEAIEPHNDEVFIQKAMIMSKKKKHQEAIVVLKEALEYIEDPADIWSMIGMEYLYLDDFENARLNFAKCIEVDFEDYSSLYNIIYCFDMEDRHEEAISYLDAYININPYCEIAWHQLGRQYYVLERYKEALAAFDYAVIIDESFIGGYLEKAKTLEELECYEEAVENYLITLELDDPTAFAYTRIGECYEKMEDLSTALHYYKKAVHEDPLLDKGWVKLTNVCLLQQDNERALHYIKKAIQIDDTNAAHWRKYADVNLKLNFYEEAVNAFTRCIDLDDNALEIYVAIADILLFLGEFNDALAIMVKAKNRYKDFAEVEYRLAGLFMILDEEQHALSHLKNALAIDFEYHNIMEQLYPSVFEHPKVVAIIEEHI